MKRSQLLLKTKKKIVQTEKSKSYELLLKGDFIDRLAAGVYTFMPLGYRVLAKLTELIRNEINNIGAQEILMPVIQPRALWEETNRWQTFDPPLFKFKDRHNREYALGPTHEEVITDIIRNRVSSYKELPLSVYQIQTKFRNEMRSTGGLLRTRELIMKDLYSFHTDEKDLNLFYGKGKEAYLKIFSKLGLEIIPVEAESGVIGGKESHEFMLVSDVGEDKMAICQGCGFAVSQEKLDKLNETKLKCLSCQGSLIIKSCIETGHTFKLGLKYSEAMGAYFTDKDGNKQLLVMGCFGLGISRLIAAIVEINNDNKGIIWPELIAPFRYHLLVFNGENSKIFTQAEKVYNFLIQKGEEVLFDDRLEVSAGEKMAEADLLGMPFRLIVSEKTGKKIEFKKRNEDKAKLVELKSIKSFL